MNKAEALLNLAEETLGLTLPIRLRAWDGSEAGQPGAPVVVIRNKRALRHVIWKPGELGVARAYVQGDLDIEGDLGEGLRAMWAAVRDARASDGSAGRPKIGPKQAAKAVNDAWKTGN